MSWYLCWKFFHYVPLLIILCGYPVERLFFQFLLSVHSCLFCDTYLWYPCIWYPWLVNPIYYSVACILRTISFKFHCLLMAVVLSIMVHEIFIYCYFFVGKPALFLRFSHLLYFLPWPCSSRYSISHWIKKFIYKHIFWNCMYFLIKSCWNWPENT